MIAQALTTSFKAEALQAIHNFAVGGDTFYVALYGPNASIDSTTTVYTPNGEITGTGYTAGGLALVNLGVTSSGTIAYTSWQPAYWPNAAISAAGALIYNASKGNRSVAVLNFGGTYTWNNATTPQVTFPSDNSYAAVVKFN